jgi:hypothetical protein
MNEGVKLFQPRLVTTLISPIPIHLLEFRMMNLDTFLRRDEILERIPKQLVLFHLHHIIMILLLLPSQKRTKHKSKSITIKGEHTDPHIDTPTTSQYNFPRRYTWK